MNQSEQINELVAALSKAQGKFTPAKFNKVNPHFGNKYADFTSVMEACRAPLSENGLSVMQYCETIQDKLTLVTMLAHTSGQWMKSNLPLMIKGENCQALGSAMTYMKRYGLSAMLGIVADEDDDDGEIAEGRLVNRPKELSVKKVTGIEKLNQEEVRNIKQMIGEDTALHVKIINTYKVSSLTEIPRTEYDVIINRINLYKETKKSKDRAK